jgi:tripartite-type tricarboxylate transporter receptor subunit TctC
MQTRRGFLQCAGAAAAAPAALQSAKALDYPSRPVRVIVPFLAGGTTDIVGRIVAQKLSEHFANPFYIENAGSGGGNIGTAQAARAAPDGYTLLCAPSSLVTNPAFLGKVPYDPVRDFAPVAVPIASAYTIAVYPPLGVRTLDELIVLLRNNPGRHTYASGGAGAQPHLAFERFRVSLGLDIVHVPFGGGVPAIAAVVAGHIPVCVLSLPNCVPYLQDGSLHALMVSSRERSQKLPDVPTAAEAGYPVLTGDQWVGFLAPAGTPAEIIALLHRGIVEAAAQADVTERLGALEFYALRSTPGEFAERIRNELQSWRRVVEEAHLGPG